MIVRSLKVSSCRSKLFSKKFGGHVPSSQRELYQVPYLSSAEVRSTFLEFFAANNHVIVPSASVIPKNDTSLLFVNAGMNQFKNVLLGKEEPLNKRIANSQKCIRAGGKHNDLDEVGHDGRHHTYFEMLGNWSFGDYFQQEACFLAYKLITEVYKLPKQSLFITYFEGDPEIGLGPDFACKETWRSIGVPDSQIIPLGMDENFWAMGDEGPCGPCTEIHYSPTGDPRHMLELWNLVFMQFNRTKRGNLEPLSTKNVDTGMGFERIVSVLQGKESSYDTDLFAPLIKRIQEITKCVPYQPKFKEHDHQGLNTAYRIIADHVRMFTVIIADGMLPGPRGAPFVLRKVIRRAAFIWSSKFNSNPVDLTQLIPTIVESLGVAYPEIAEKADLVAVTVEKEVKEFEEVLLRGSKAFNDVYKKLENKMVLPADKMFLLYSANGIPEEMLLSFAKSRNMTCDLQGFHTILEEQREKSRESLKKKRLSVL